MKRAILLLVGFGVGSVLLHLFCCVTLQQFKTAQTVAVITKAEGEGVAFPCSIADTALQAVRLVSYDGPFLEDGSDDEVTEIAALVVKNVSEDTYMDGRITLSFAQDKYVFEFFALPPGKEVLALEKSRKPYTRELVLSCNGYATDRFSEQNPDISAQIVGLGALEISNFTNKMYPGLTVYYKTYDEESKMYIGGIVYSTRVMDLQPGEVRINTPYHMATGYTRIVSVVLD